MGIEFGGLLKKIMENNYYQALFSVFLTFAFYYFLSDDSPIFIEFGKYWGVVFIFVSCILTIESLCFGWKYARRYYITKVEESNLDVENEKMTKDILEKLWLEVDNLSRQDKEDLRLLLSNGNTPILVGDVWYSQDSLLYSAWVYKATYSGEELIKDTAEFPDGFGGTNFIEFDCRPTYQYKLKEEIYNLLKYSEEKYGRISNFD